jgi:hypothetical protein
LKPCRNTKLPILRTINQQDLPTYRAYNIRLELTDDYGVRRTSIRLYLAIDRDPGDSQILLGMTALTDLKIPIDCDTCQWQYQITNTNIRLHTYKRFQRRLKGARVYALVEIHHLITSEPQLADTLPQTLQDYLDVFAASNAKNLAPHRDVDLAIDLQPEKEPPYGPIYPLS